VDTRKELKDFQERYEATQEGPTDGGPACTGQARAEEVSGQFLLAVSPAFSRPTPILFRATVEAQDAGSEVRFTLALQALSAADRKTPVGGPLGNQEATTSAGMFSLDFGQLTIPGEADPLIPNAPIISTVTLAGQVCGADPATGTLDVLCGSVTGLVTAPAEFDLAGSTWAARRIPDDGTLPEIALDCALTAPKPL
jgi:hypothetical protein